MATTLAHDHQGSLKERLRIVQQRMAAAATRAARSIDEITLIAISKTHPTSTLREALAAGIVNLGENRVQEAELKILKIGRSKARWHLVGHLQSNKSRRAVQLFDCIHSLDSAELARRLERMCAEESKDSLDVLIQVDMAAEPTKSGIAESQVQDVANVVKECPHLSLQGLMVLPPYFENAEDARPFFKRLRELRDELHSKGYFVGGGELSMGMTHDFEIAIEEGATMVRIGTAIFGEREQRALK